MTYLATLVAAVALTVGAQAQEVKGTTGTRDPAPLEGTWVITSINGQEVPEGAQPLTLTFNGDKYYQTLGTDVNERGSFKLDTSAKPMTIDLMIVEGDDAGKTQLGIVEIAGDTVRASFDTPGAGERPTDFAQKEGNVNFVGKKKS